MSENLVVTAVSSFREMECSSCQWFDRSVFDGFDAHAGPGFCRRFPPVVYVPGGGRDGARQAFPVVSAWDWCGEWVVRES